MKKFFLFITFLLFASTPTLFADQLTTTYVDSPTAILKQTNTNPKHWFYEINLKFNRSKNADVYLVTQKTPKNGGQQDYATLCHIPSSTSSPVTVSYPDKSNQNCDSSPINNDFFEPGNDYVFYLSDQSNGVVNLDSDMTLIVPDRGIPQSSTSQNPSGNSVSFEIGESSFARIRRGNTYWGLHIDPPQGGKVHRQKDETVYFVLKELNGNKKQTLCKFDGGALEFSGPSFPGCFVEDSSKLFNFNGVTYGIVDIIEYGKEYGVYFSSDLEGNNAISGVKSLGKAIPKGDTVIDPNLTVELKKKDNGYYFHIEGDVVKARPVNLPQDAKLYLTLVDENQNSYPIGVIPYEKGTHFSEDSSVLDSGSYGLRVRTKLDVENSSESRLDAVIDLQTIPLQKQIPGSNPSNQPNTTSNITSSGSNEYSDYDGKSLVPLNCGYNLGEGGRMCTLNDFIRMIRRVISYIFIIMIPIAAIVFAYAGYQLLFSGGNTQKRDAAKKAATNLLIGIVVFLLAWVIVNLIVSTLGLKSDFNIFFGS